jgi:hypothetical protein
VHHIRHRAGRTTRPRHGTRRALLPHPPHSPGSVKPHAV